MADPSADEFHGGSRSIADPTPLTTQQLIREIAALKELLVTRLDGMDKAMTLFNDNMTRAPTEVQKQISHLKEFIIERFLVHDEKFSSIQTQFRERDTRTEQLSVASKVAVDAALQAAKELGNEQNKSAAAAIAKSEGATIKQIDQIGVLINSTNKATDDKIDDLKARVGKAEGAGQGSRETKDDSRATTNMLIGAVGLLLAIGLAVVGFRSGNGQAPVTPQPIVLQLPSGALVPAAPVPTPK